MAESTDRRVRKTPEEKLSELQSKNRMGMDEIALQLGCRLPHLKLTAKVGREILDTFLEIVKESLKGGRNVVFPGFGSFVVKERKARRVRNPRETEGPKAFKEVGPSTVFRFKPGSDMKPIFHD